ncbi:MAG: hypothetical protein ACE5HY_06915, partial [Candidatus Hydrothermarchaeales archaeon]
MNEKDVEKKEERILEEKKEVAYDFEDAWLFTSISAKDKYRREGKLDELERDIRNSVMSGKPWRSEDIEYLKEVQRLVDEGIIEEEASRWAVSPFPPVYRALRSGEMTIGGRRYTFKKGEQLVFQCRMEQEKKVREQNLEELKA